MSARTGAMGLLLAAAGLIAYKLLFAGYSLAAAVPEVAYDVQTRMRFEGRDEPVRVRLFLPRTDDRQRVRQESFDPSDLTRREEIQGENRRVIWESPSVSGPRSLGFSLRVSARAARYALPEGIPIARDLPPGIREHLDATSAIQVDDPVVGALLERLAPEPRSVDRTLQAIFDYTRDKLEPAPNLRSGTVDALTTLKLGEASCSGKSRLFAALARRAGLPTRLVGGLIMKDGSKRTSHQWVETWVNGVWIPFCPLNDHFAEIPARYLRLYTGDEFLFSHTAHINFDYRFHITSRLETGEPMTEGAEPPPWGPDRLWELFRRNGISMELVRVLLMLPLGAMITVVFRNVVGIRAFGTFLPALLAVAYRGTGLLWGLTAFAALLAIVGLARLGMDRMNLLHTPKLAMMLTIVIIAMLALTAAAASQGLASLAYISLFPIAVTTLTTERFAVTVQEEGWREALSLSAQTALVVAGCYLAMESSAMQSLFMAFPELLLAVLAIDLWVGCWMGLRLTEYVRFGMLWNKGARA